MKNSTQAMFNVLKMPKRHENDLSHVKHTMRKAAALFVFAVFLACAATPALAAGLAKISDIQGGGGASKKVDTGADIKYEAVSPDRTIYFGNYWQTAKEGKEASTNLGDYNKEGIKWRVLANNTRVDDHYNIGVLLLSDQALFADYFNTGSGAALNYWRNQNNNMSSEIRKDLTGVTDGSENSAVAYNDLEQTTVNEDGTVSDGNWGSFAGDAFSAGEYAAIAETAHTAGGTKTGHDIESIDKLFILSYEELQESKYGFVSGTNATDIRKVSATDMARKVRMYGNAFNVIPSSGAAAWWLRSPAQISTNPYSIDYNGSLCDNASGIQRYDYAARAACNLDRDFVLFLSAAEDGKGLVNVGGGFKLADYNGENGWKLTLKDSDIVAPTDVAVTRAKTGGVDDLAAAAAEGETIDLTKGTAIYTAPVVTYTAAAITDKKANCVSAIVADGDGNYVNYAKISDQASETDKVIPSVNLADGTYKMFIFAEKANGDKQTDYASDFRDNDGYEFTKSTEAEIVYSGKLSKKYKDKDLTVRLGGGFKLSFENAEYTTKVSVVDNDPNNKLTGGVNDTKSAGFLAAIDTVLGTEIASDTDGTTLKGKVTVKEAAQIACYEKIVFKDLQLDGVLNIEDNAVVELYGIQNGGNGSIVMKASATLNNQSDKEIPVWVISGDKKEPVKVEPGKKYSPKDPESTPTPTPTPAPTPSKGGSSSVGCNAGFGIAMLLSAAAAMLCKRKRG